MSVATGQRTIPFTRVSVCLEARQAADDVLASGWLTTGPRVLEFEQQFAEFVGARHAVAVSSCTAAIELGLRALQLPRGAKVLTSTLTFCGVAQAIAHAGCRPVLVDVETSTMMPSAAQTAMAARRAGGVDAMVVVHFAGHPAPVPELAAAAGLPLSRVVEDAAHGPGIALGDTAIGAISAATCFSFYATKNLPIGEGGMLTTDDDDVAGRVRSARLHGMNSDAWRRYTPGASWRYSVERAGLKANMTDLQAAIGLAQLAHLPTWQARRHEIADRYIERLGPLSGIVVPGLRTSGTHSWHLFVVQLRDFALTRDDTIEALAAMGVNCSVHFIPIHHHGFAQRSHERTASLPGADALFPTLLSLPLYPDLSDDEVGGVCDALAELAERPRSR